MTKKKTTKSSKEPKSRVITAENMRDHYGFMIMGLFFILFAIMIFYSLNGWYSGGGCSIQSGFVCELGEAIIILFGVGFGISGIALIITAYYYICGED